ncbi:MAG: HAD hydrolase-like protein [Chlamydiia bacterium]
MNHVFRRPRCIYFDLDGTLIDSKDGITKSIRFALDELGVPIPPARDLAWCIGYSLQDIFRMLINNPSENALQAALNSYRERYQGIGIYEAELYAGIESMLSSLHQAGHRLFVATSKPEVFASRVLSHLGIGQYFERIYGPHLDDVQSDKGLLLHRALAHELKDDALMVGDRKFDVMAAAQNGILSLGVTYGYGTREELEEAGATALCHSPAGIIEYVISREAADGHLSFVQ